MLVRVCVSKRNFSCFVQTVGNGPQSGGTRARAGDARHTTG